VNDLQRSLDTHNALASIVFPMTSNGKQDDPISDLELSAGVGDGESMPPLKDVKAWERFDQERARQIENDDLTRKNKQVGTHIPS
jgi:hypothetical protein